MSLLLHRIMGRITSDKSPDEVQQGFEDDFRFPVVRRKRPRKNFLSSNMLGSDLKLRPWRPSAPQEKPMRTPKLSKKDLKTMQEGLTEPSSRRIRQKKEGGSYSPKGKRQK